MQCRFRSFWLLLLSVSLPFFAQAGQHGLGLMTGAKTGTYYLIGKDIEDAAGKAGIPVLVRESKGSIDNLQTMATTGENAALGIVQSDVISFLLRSPMPKSKVTASKLRLVAPLFKEEIHLLARKDIKTFDDLKDKRIVVGSAGSGSMMTAVNLLSQLGIKPKRLFEVSPAEAVVAVLANRADAMVFVGGKPVPMFKNLEKLSGMKEQNMGNLLKDIHFLEIPEKKSGGIYEISSISSQDYNFVDKEVSTLAVRAVLVAFDFTRKDTPYYHTRCKQLASLGRTLGRELPNLQTHGHAKWQEVDLQRDINLWERDRCIWPALNTNVKVAKAVKEEPKPVIPRRSALEKELLDLITEGK